jgi:hypothetical protein
MFRSRYGCRKAPAPHWLELWAVIVFMTHEIGGVTAQYGCAIRHQGCTIFSTGEGDVSHMLSQA